MTTFSALPALARAFFALWALLMLLALSVCFVSAARKRQFPFFALALLLFAPAYLAWQTVFDRYLLSATGSVSPVTETLCGLRFVWWLAAFLALTGATACLSWRMLRYKKDHVTPDSVKLFLDKIPCGVCCYAPSGRVLFSNVCMNRLCVALTDEPLLDGNAFAAAVADTIREADGAMWRFTCRDVAIGGERLRELIASDVTGEYAKTQALKRDREELDRINRERRAYTLGIDETVRRQEILQAKVRIHDEMNKLMLSTVAAETGSTEELDRIFSLWKRNALLLCLEADGASDAAATNRLEELAGALKMRLSWEGGSPERLPEEKRGLFFSAAQEAIANAAKHAGAKRMTIAFSETEREMTIRFISDGKMPESVTFTGGLANLSRLAKERNATVDVSVENDEFVLAFRFPLRNPPIG